MPDRPISGVGKKRHRLHFLEWRMLTTRVDSTFCSPMVPFRNHPCFLLFGNCLNKRILEENGEARLEALTNDPAKMCSRACFPQLERGKAASPTRSPRPFNDPPWRLWRFWFLFCAFWSGSENLESCPRKFGKMPLHSWHRVEMAMGTPGGFELRTLVGHHKN